MEKTVSKFLRSLDIPVSRKYVEAAILSHADYPSLLSISDVFERLGLNYSVFRSTQEDLINVDLPYLLPVSSHGGDIVMIESHRQLEREKLLDQWTGIVIRVDGPKMVTDRNALKAYTEQRVVTSLGILLLTGVVLALLFPFILSFGWLNTIMLASAIGGAVLGYILVAKDVGIRYNAVEAFCNSSKEVSCDKVLSSEGSVVFGVLKFSDLVMIYFSFQVLALWSGLIIPGASSSILFTLSVLSLAGLPMICYSVYYQWAVVKAWCRLCLLVDAVLLLQAVIFGLLLFGHSSPVAEPLLVASTLTGFLFEGSFFVLLRIFLTRLNRLETGEPVAARVRNTIPVFTGMLKQQGITDTMPFEKELVAGDKNAPIRIVMATNLFCNPCKQKHSVVADLLANYPGKIAFAFRFVRTGRDQDSVAYILRYWLKHIEGRENESLLTAKLMHDWFHFMDFAKFKTKYADVAVEYNEPASKIENEHYEWADKRYFQLTPTFFVNGYRLAFPYEIDHLTAIIPSLVHEIGRLRQPVETLQES